MFTEILKFLLKLGGGLAALGGAVVLTTNLYAEWKGTIYTKHQECVDQYAQTDDYYVDNYLVCSEVRDRAISSQHFAIKFGAIYMIGGLVAGALGERLPSRKRT